MLGAVLSLSAYSAEAPLVRSWVPQIGDRFVVDTRDNLGYLIHPNGARFVFRVATGQRRTVRYIGLTYFAATPEGSWIVRSHSVKGDRITYGPAGHFLRLYRDGQEYSHYGIHAHADAERMLRDEDRFASMGCIIVSEQILDILEKTYALHDGELPVTTIYGFEKESLFVLQR